MFAILTSGLPAVSLASGIGVGAGFGVGTAAGVALTEGVEDAPVFVPALGETAGAVLAEAAGAVLAEAAGDVLAEALGVALAEGLGVALAEALGVALAEGLGVTLAEGVRVCKGISDGITDGFAAGEGESTDLSGVLVEVPVAFGVAFSSSPFTDIVTYAFIFEPSVVFAVIVTLPDFLAFTVPFLVTDAVAGLELL